MHGNADFASYVIPLLQPIKTENKTLLADDARVHLDLVLNELESIDNAEAARQGLQQLYKQKRDEWRLALGLLYKWAKESVNENDDIEYSYRHFAQKLWSISKWNLETQQQNDTEDDFWFYAPEKLQGTFSNGSAFDTGIYITLQREMYRTQRFLAVYQWEMDDPVPQEVKNDQLLLLFFEGLRQQLEARKGFLCPYSKGRQHCQCNQPIREYLRRLSHLASDGLFGAGEWSLSPCLAARRL
jgi:hypothetical protein